MDGIEDGMLVKRSAGGDGQAYGTLVERYSRGVFALCLGLLGNAHEAEDAAQDAFVKGYEHLGRLRDGGRFGAWVTGIARNRCLDLIRRRRRRAEALVEISVETGSESGAYDDLHDAIGRLDEQYRLPLLLYYFDGRNSEGVARVLEISTAGAQTRLSRARRELRRLLAAGEGERNG